MRLIPLFLAAAIGGAYLGAHHMAAINQRIAEQELALAFGCGFLNGQMNTPDKVDWLKTAAALEKFDCPYYRDVALRHGIVAEGK